MQKRDPCSLGVRLPFGSNVWNILFNFVVNMRDLWISLLLDVWVKNMTFMYINELELCFTALICDRLQLPYSAMC